MNILLYADKLHLVNFDEIVKSCEGVELVIDNDKFDIRCILSLTEYCAKRQIELIVNVMDKDLDVEYFELVGRILK